MRDDEQQTVDTGTISRALRAWQGMSRQVGIDLRTPASSPFHERRSASPSRSRDLKPRRRQEQSDPRVLSMTLHDIEQGGKLIARTLSSMGFPTAADLFGEHIRRAVDVAEDALRGVI